MSKRQEKEGASTLKRKTPSSEAGKPGAGYYPTEEEKAACLILGYKETLTALENEEPVAVAVATECILAYSTRVGELLKQGRDYLDLLTPGPETPAIERIAMEVVLETVEEELDNEE